jgi:hypothetical protein
MPGELDERSRDHTIRRLAKRMGIYAKKRHGTGKWYFFDSCFPDPADPAKYYQTPEHGLDSEEAYKWLKSRLAARLDWLCSSTAQLGSDHKPRTP